MLQHNNYEHALKNYALNARFLYKNRAFKVVKTNPDSMSNKRCHLVLHVLIILQHSTMLNQCTKLRFLVRFYHIT